ncbi:MAG: SRPBCC family protein [Gammaproteobacteria bacterium]|nr:SRPBCC family protein [Gammaproteobacteria bacterium]
MTTTTQPLRSALIANAVFSAGCGAAMLIAPRQIDAWLALGHPLMLQVVGPGLLVFAADLLHQATRPRLLTWRALYASVADLLWVIGTLALLLIAPSLVSATGATLMLAIAAVVLTFGLWQLWGIDRAHRAATPSRYRHCVQVAVDVPADAMWNVISQLGEIERYMPSLRSSKVLDDQPDGVGAVRVCENHAGKRWGEECTRFEDGRGFDVRFLAEDPDFPFPATIMFGGWEVIPRGEGSEVRVWWELEPKPKLLAPVMLPMLAFGVDREFPRIIQRMAAAAMGNGPLASDAAQRMPRAGLSSYPC